MMKRLIPILLLLALIAAVVYRTNFGDASPAEGRTELLVSGNIETHETIVSFKLAGRIAELLAEEGQWMEAGQGIARLADEDIRQQVALDEASLRVARAQLRLAEAGARPQELAAARLGIREVEAEVAQRKLDFERAEALYQKDAGSRQARDRADTALKRSTAVLERLREQYNQLQEGLREEEISIARAYVIRAREVLRLSRIRLGHTKLQAPRAGVVLVRQAEPGEVVAPGTPVVTLADLDHVWLRAYISETDLGRVRWGQTVTLRTDTYPEKTYRGRITFIASKAEFTPKTIETHKERVTLVYRIKIDAENPNHELKPGMPADAVIDTSSGNESAAQTP